MPRIVIFFSGHRSETKASAMKTLDFAIEHQDCIDFLNLAIFNLPSGSIEAQNLVTQDFYEGDLSLYKSFQHPHGLASSGCAQFFGENFQKTSGSSTDCPAYAGIFHLQPRPVFCFKQRLHYLTSPTNPQYLKTVRIEDYWLKESKIVFLHFFILFH